VVPDDVNRVTEPTFAHRLVLTDEAAVRGADRSEVLADVLEQVDVPAVKSSA
jgi:MoxR-like ATPase